MSVKIKNISSIRNTRIEKLSPNLGFDSFFTANQSGIWYDPSDLSSIYQDSNGTTAVTAVNDPVGKMDDKSGNINHAAQSTSTFRPLYNTDSTKHWIDFDGTDDYLQGTITESFSEGITISLKVKFNTTLNRQYIFSKRDGADENNIQLGTNASGELSFLGWGLSTVSSTFSGQLTLGQWYYIEASYDPVNSIVKIRVDDTVETFSRTGTLTNTVSTFRIGDDWYDHYANISMQEMFVYDRALDSTESDIIKSGME